MSGPNDSGAGSASGGLQLTLPVVGAPPGPSDRFRLGVAWQTPHLEWKPVTGPDPTDPAAPAPPPPDDPPKAISKAERYFQSGLLFDLRRPDWSKVDKAFLFMPPKPPLLFPKGEGLDQWREDIFFRDLSSTPYPVLPPTPTPLPNLPIIPAQQNLFFKQPDPSAMNKESGPSKHGSVGDLLGAIWNLPVVQRLVARMNDEVNRNGRQLATEWHDIPTWGNVGVIGFGATLAAGALAGLLGAQDSRKWAAENILGVKLPIPFTPGFSLQVNGLGPLTDWAFGRPTQQQLMQQQMMHTPARSHEGSIMIYADMRRTIKIIKEFF